MQKSIRQISIIIPTLNSASYLPTTIQSIREQSVRADVLAVDGGSQDDTRQILQTHNIPVIQSASGRGLQMNAGAEICRGEIFMFLHADTQLAPDALAVLLDSFQNPAVNIGTCRMAFDHPSLLLKVYGYCTRFDSLWTSFGDQCIVIRRSLFNRLGGFPQWPLFEDVRLLQNARRVNERVHSFRCPVTTCPRKFLKNGIIRQQLHNGFLILRYLLGESPERLNEEYD